MNKLLFFGLIFSAFLFSYKNNNSGCINGSIDTDDGESMTINGSANIKGNTLKNLTVNGSATIKEVTVSEDTKINGSVKLKESDLGSLTVNGSADLKSVTVKGLVVIYGSGDFKDSQFQDLELGGTRFDFTDTKVAGNIHVEPAGFFAKKEQLLVLNDTIVSGNIVFDSEKGIVELQGSSEITGEVVGGVITE